MDPRRFATLALTCLLGLGSLAATLEAQPPAEAIRIGMVTTFFHDIPRPLIDLVTDPFQIVMREATGMNGQLAVEGDYLSVGKRLQDGKLQLGVFHGFEFAWLTQRYPELRPLMVVVNDHKQVRAYLLARKSDDISTAADLKGKAVSLPRRSKEHARLFLERLCADANQGSSKGFLHDLVTPPNVETALDDLYRGKVQGVVVDNLGLEFYKDLKPGVFAQFKIVQESDLFPPPVIAYRTGHLDDATLRRVRAGLLSAHNLTLGREMMKLWKVQSFESVPNDYPQALADSLKAYPAPEPPATKLSQR